MATVPDDLLTANPRLARLSEAVGHGPIAVDGMGGDDAPTNVVAGARLALEDRGVPVLLVGRPDELGDTGDVPVVEASEVIAMDADPGSSVRKMKDSSLVRCAESVRDGWAAGMVSAGNTGAAMASSLLRMGRIKGVARPALAIPMPSPGGSPTVILDVGANAECQPEWLVQFGQLGCALSRTRFGVDRPRVGLMSIGEESVKGDRLVKEAHALMTASNWLDAAGGTFVGNVEGRDLMSAELDVVVTDGFTGNVALKSMEGALDGVVATMRSMAGSGSLGEVDGAGVESLLVPLLDELHPDNAGGALLLGVRGVSVISHGSSSPGAMANAIELASAMCRADIVGVFADTIARST